MSRKRDVMRRGEEKESLCFCVHLSFLFIHFFFDTQCDAALKFYMKFPCRFMSVCSCGLFCVLGGVLDSASR